MWGRKKLKTGEIAEYCGVTFRTVIRWIERGELKAYQLPGRGDNRVSVPDFIQFLKRNNMPIPDEFQDKSTKVLIVEDDKLMALGMEKTLRKHGFETKIVANGFMAGTALSTFSPAVMTLDLHMPGLDGFEVLKFLRNSSDVLQVPPVKVVVVSALSQKELQVALDAGADDILQKPFDNRIFLQKVSRLAGIKGHISSSENQRGSHANY